MIDLQNESARNSAQNQRGRICVNRGSIGSMNSIMGDMSFLGQELIGNGLGFGFGDFEVERESLSRKFGEEIDIDRGGRFSRMSEENSQFMLRMSESQLNRGSRGVNWVLRLPQGKNSDQILQKMDPQMDPFGADNSNRNSNELLRQALRISTEHSNNDRSLEIVMEWTDHVVDPIELQEMINRLSIQEPPVQIKPDRLSLLPVKILPQGCICKKTKCLKLYCQCFQAGKICSEQCECLDCSNNDIENDDRKQAIQAVIEKNPDAFKSKTEDAPQIEEQSQAIKRVVKGCNCKKSRCQKKYCECYNAGIGCGPNCNCEQCLNCEIQKEQLLHGMAEKEALDHELSFDQIPHRPQKRAKL